MEDTLCGPERAPKMTDAFGDAIRKARVAKGLTLRQLALIADVSHTHLWSVEQGFARCSEWFARRVSEALEMNPDHLPARESPRSHNPGIRRGPYRKRGAQA